MILTLKIFSKNRFIFVLKILNHAAILYKIIDLCYAADLIKFVFNINKWLDLVNVFSSKKKKPCEDWSNMTRRVSRFKSNIDDL